MFAILKKAINSIYYRLTRKRKLEMFISAIDLMQPINGQPTAAQLTVISRMFDIELVRQGKKSWWDVRINHCRRNLKAEEEDTFHNQTEKLVHSMDKYGWNFNLSQVNVNRDPFYAYNGTHRLAYTLLNNPYEMVPIRIDADGWLWSRESGYDYFIKSGLTIEEVEKLNDRYKVLVEKTQMDHLIIFPLNYYLVNKEKITELLSNIGTIIQSKQIRQDSTHIPLWLSATERKIFKRDSLLAIFLIKVNNKDLILKNGAIKLKSVEEGLQASKIRNCIYSPTCTKAIELNVWLKENTTEI